MSNYWATADRVTPAMLFDYAEANTVAFEPGKPIHVKRVVLVGVEVASDAETITVAVRDAGDGGNSVTVGTFAIPDGFAVDAVAYVELAKPDADGETADVVSQDIPDASTLIFTSGGVIEVAVGKEIVLTSGGTGSTTGQANAYFEYSEQGQDLNGMTELVFTPA